MQFGLTAGDATQGVLGPGTVRGRDVRALQILAQNLMPPHQPFGKRPRFRQGLRADAADPGARRVHRRAKRRGEARADGDGKGKVA